MPSPDNLNLLGIDVGYSEKRLTTGIARCGPAGFATGVASRHWESRSKVIGEGTQFDCVAIDGPLVPVASNQDERRSVEYAFIREPFARRCKPGLSHFGQGFTFRVAAAETARQIIDNGLVGIVENDVEPAAVATVEAFPNGFLGVLLSDAIFKRAGRFKRGRRFDWLYEEFIRAGLHLRLMEEIRWTDRKLEGALTAEHDHEKRAALICLLTAGCAAMGEATVLGDRRGGWFWLPPRSRWADWARSAPLPTEITQPSA